MIPNLIRNPKLLSKLDPVRSRFVTKQELPYSESKLESNLSEILSVKCKLIGCSTSTWSDKPQTWVLEFWFYV